MVLWCWRWLCRLKVESGCGESVLALSKLMLPCVDWGGSQNDRFVMA